MKHDHGHHGHSEPTSHNELREPVEPQDPGRAAEAEDPAVPRGTRHDHHDRTQGHRSDLTSHPAGHSVNGGHDKHAGHSVEMFRRKFFVSLLLTVPTLVWGEMIPHALGFTPPAVPGARWIPVVFGTLVFLYGGWVFIQGAWRELADRKPGMMTLISLAITVAFVFSVAVTFGFQAMPLWWEVASLVTIMLLGHWMEMRSITQAQGALRELAKLLPNTATRLEAGRPVDVPISALQDGDLVLVRPGASVPADGVVREGRSALNESMITGESRMVEKQAGDRVIAGTVNGEGALRIEVTRTGDRTALAGIMRLVAQAQQSRSRAQVVADRAAFFLTIAAVGAATGTAVVWTLLAAPAAFTVERAVTVLVIACPHALGLAVPLVVAISTTIGARSGLLVRDRRGLEEARNVSTVVFDKTGTLTLGQHRVVAMRTAEGLSDAEALRLAASVEYDAEHPVARAIVLSAEERGIASSPGSDFRAIPGHGVEAVVEGRRLAGGGPNLLTSAQVELAPPLRVFADDASARGQGVVYLLELPHQGSRAGHRQRHATTTDGQRTSKNEDSSVTARGKVLAAFAVADAVRPESAEAVRRLQRDGIEVVMLTGDARPVAETVARELGIDTVFAQVLPEDKAAKIKELQGHGKRVAMVGDGVNDAPALLTADVGVAIGAGTDVAVEAGDIVLVRNDPRDVARIVALSKATYRKMVQNLWWAAGYNIVAIPLAAGVFQRWGIVLSPAIGAVLMSLSTIIVAVNAQLLRRARLA